MCPDRLDPARRLPTRPRPARCVTIACHVMTAALLHLLPRSASAHPNTPVAPHDLASAWTLEPWVLLLVFGPALLHVRGTARVWSSAGRGHGVRGTHAAAFAAGTLVLAIALISPLDALGSALFSAHMAQHQLLMVVAPPLYLLGAPAVAFAWSVPPRHTALLIRVVRRAAQTRLWRALSHPVGAWSVHAIAVWLWHMPALYEQTLSSEWVHAVQHFFFVVTAMLFWWTVIHPRGEGARGRGAAVLSLFTTAVHTSALAALLTFSSHPWYLAYAGRTQPWGFSLLEDQQLGGLIMWIPGGIVYTAAALIVTASWLRDIERRTKTRMTLGTGATAEADAW
jgi:putative membrane protein